MPRKIAFIGRSLFGEAFRAWIGLGADRGDALELPEDLLEPALRGPLLNLKALWGAILEGCIVCDWKCNRSAPRFRKASMIEGCGGKDCSGLSRKVFVGGRYARDERGG
jgi:hypothetical protein